MGGLLFVFSPELLILSLIALVLCVWLLLHLRSFVRNTLATAALLFAWAMQAGFVGFIVYVAAWVFMFPVIATLCAVVALMRTWGAARSARELKRQARASRAARTKKPTEAWYVSDGETKRAEIDYPTGPR